MHPGAAHEQPTIGPYRVLGSLGAGGVGQVYRVQDAVGRQLALKLLGRAGNEARDKRFAREGELTAQLNHPGIVRVHGRGVSPYGPYLVYELIEGHDLERCFERLSREQLLDVILQVADALGYAHQHGVIHRDVKPGNVLLDAQGRAFLADFGMAQAAGVERLTRSGAMVGTPHYMSPEQALGQRDDYGPPTDVWALGVLLYRVLGGQAPFAGGSLMQLMAQITSEPPPDLRAEHPDLAPGLVEVCLRALEKDPLRRYPDGAAFAADLRRARAGESVEGRAALPGRSYGPLAGAVLLALALASLAGWGLTQPGGSPGPEPTPAAATPEPAPAPDPALARLPGEAAQLVTALAAGDPRSRTLLERLEQRVASRPERERALWREAVARLAQLAEPTELEPQRPLLELLARLPGEGRAPASEPAQRLADLGVRRAADLLEGGSAGFEGGGDQERVDACLELLDLLASCGLRAHERGPAQRILDGMVIRWQVGTISEASYWWVLLAGLRLDFALFPFNAYLDPQGRTPAEERQRPWAEDTRDPWQRCLEPWILLEVSGSRRDLIPLLRECLDDPEGFAGAPWGLGPRAQASLGAFLARLEGGERGLARLQRAMDADPSNPAPHLVSARLLRDGRRLEEALVASARAVELFEATYARDLHRVWTYADILSMHIKVLARLERRDEARAEFLRLGEVSPGEAADVQQRFPWLKEE